MTVKLPQPKEKWEFAKKIVVYDWRSLFLFNRHSKFRRLVVGITES